nr:MAG TPA: baseplate wedge protein [Caudoviricetes sp.]
MKQLSYSGKDIDEISKSIFDYIKSVTSKFTDFNDSDLGVLFVKILSGVADMSYYYMDNQALETFITTARQPKNIRNILELINYKIDVVGSAKGHITMKIDSRDPNEFKGYTFLLPRYTRLSVNSSPKIDYVTVEDMIIQETQQSVQIKVMQGKKRTLTLKNKDLSYHWKYKLPQGKIPIDSVYLSQDGSYWKRVEDAILEIDGGKKFSVHHDNEGNAYIIFSYDWKDYLSSNNESAFIIEYVESIGVAGIVPPLTINSIDDRIFDSKGNDITKKLKISNQVRTFGAYDETDLTIAKSNARNYIKTMGRYITLRDYHAGVIREPYILKAQTLDWNVAPDIITRPHLVTSWVVTTDGANLRNFNLKDLAKKIYSKGIATTQVVIKSAEFVDIALNVDIYVKGTGEYREEIRKVVEDTLKNELSIKNLKFGDRWDYRRVSIIVMSISNNIVDCAVHLDHDYVLSQIQFPNFTDITVRLVGDDYGQP